MSEDTMFDAAAIWAEVKAEDEKKKEVLESSKTDLQHKSLEDFIEDEDAEAFTADNLHYKIRTDDEADAKVIRYHKLQKELDKVEKEAAAYLEKKQQQVEAWKESVSSPIQSEMDYLQTILREYAEENYAINGKKTLKLVDGNLRLYKAQPKFSYEDDTLRDYLMSVPEGKAFLKQQMPKVDKTSLKKSCEIQDGKLYFKGGKESIPGVSVEEQNGLSFSIK